MQIDIGYEGDLSTRCVHRETGVQITTDAPKDHQGLGRGFSPTDLMAASVGSCMLTLMGIAAKKWDVDIKGTKLVIQKEMQTAPIRRIGAFLVVIDCPHHFSQEITEALMKAAHGCPVKQSLHPDIEWTCQFNWGGL